MPPQRVQELRPEQLALLYRTVEANPYIPKIGAFPSKIFPKQALFLASSAREALYGGAAGGGKSVALLMAALQFVEVPGYSALLLRRTFRDLAQPGALIPLSKQWLSGKARWNQLDKRWTFPSGATLTFGYLDHLDDIYQYQGSNYQFIGWDELTQFEESQYLYLFSRLRRPQGYWVPLRMRAASNPGGIGHDWVKRRFLLAQAPDCEFYPAKIADNPGIDSQEYLQSLANLDSLTRQRLLHGDWDAHEGGRFHRHWFRYYYRRNDLLECRHSSGSQIIDLQQCCKFVTVDPAASQQQQADYSVISTWALAEVAGIPSLLWLECDRFQADIPEIIPRLRQAFLRWQPQWIGIEAVAANRAVLQLAQREKNPVLPCRPLNPRGTDKLVRAMPAICLAEMGRVYLPANDPQFPLDSVLGELTCFTGDPRRDAHDDIVDTLSYAVEILQQQPSGKTIAPRVIS